jgi:ribonuclease VapC
MFIDASALTAMVAGEPEAAEFLARLQRSRIRITSPIAMWETAVAVARLLDLSIKEAGQAAGEFVELMEIEAVAILPEAGALALDAFDRYGKGRHPARLNMGDCFAYASARHLKQPLLYKGADFAQTDIEAA